MSLCMQVIEGRPSGGIVKASWRRRSARPMETCASMTTRTPSSRRMARSSASSTHSISRSTLAEGDPLEMVSRQHINRLADLLKVRPGELLVEDDIEEIASPALALA